MFQLTAEEWTAMSSQIVMTSWNKRPKSALPLAFTEHGVVMLSSVLHSDIAVQTSILITHAFVAMRQIITMPPIDKVSLLQQEMKETADSVFRNRRFFCLPAGNKAESLHGLVQLG